jgi:hypothetical protein
MCVCTYMNEYMNEMYGYTRRCLHVRMCVYQTGAFSRSFVRGDAFMFVCVCMNEAYDHCHSCEAMLWCSFSCS